MAGPWFLCASLCAGPCPTHASQPPSPQRRLARPSPALRGRRRPRSPTWSGATAGGPPPQPVQFPGVPSPGREAPQPVRANRCSGHHTRPVSRSQSAPDTSPPRRRGRPIRLRHCRRSSRPIGRGNVRAPRRTAPGVLSAPAPASPWRTTYPGRGESGVRRGHPRYTKSPPPLLRTRPSQH